MRLKYIKYIVSLSVLFFVSSINAAEEDSSVWKSEAELGVVLTRGNSDTSTINAKFDATRESKKWRHNIHTEALKAASDKVTSAAKSQLSGKIDYKFNEFDYAFGLINFEKDRFNGFEHQTTISSGYGRRLLNEETVTLDVEVGPGIRYTKIDEKIDPLAETVSDVVIRLATNYAWKISENSEFTEDLNSDIGEDVTISKSVTGLKANINKSLAMKLTVTLKNTSVVPVGSRETDTETSLTLVYSF